MSYPASSTSRRASRNLLVGAATIALVVAAMQRPVAAQSFQGTPTVATGGATVSTAPNNTTVNINAPVTVINWRPDDTTGTGTIVFQPVGTTALFRSANSPNFTVLNRILPVDANGAPVITRAIRFDGTVNSQFGAGSAITAGSIWFYTPGGVILGASSAFNVGSLVLSTSDINQANVFVGNNGTINFTGTPNVTSSITIENGAQVNALINGSSYVAMVAPRIVQNGTIQVNGSAALVGAEAVDIIMNGGTGLFDIAVSTGTGDSNGVVHGDFGTTTGPASTGTADPQRIYMMAIPKNSAISMLVNGNVGYTPAASATVQNGEVVLSAGYNIQNGLPDFGEHAIPANANPANIVIGETSTQSTSFSTRVFARASGNLRASPGPAINGPGLLSFSSSAFLFGDLSSTVETTANEFVGIGGDLFVSSRSRGQGGNAAVRVVGGLIGVGGDLTIDANSIGFSGQASGINTANPVGGNGQAGNASLVVADGALRITGTTQVIARGVGGYGTDTAGNGTGGNASVNLSGINSQIQFGQGLDVQAGGFGILSYLSLFGINLDPAEGVIGGDGRGGLAEVIIDDVALLTLPTIIINASGSGDNGGTVGDGGGANGGSGIGGTASLAVNNEALILPDLTVESSGSGGNGGRSDDPNQAAGNGGSGTGGGAAIILRGGASLNRVSGFAGGMTAIASGNGGAGGSMISGSTLDSGSGGAATGGTADIRITGASQVNVATISALADARTGSVGSSGTNFGGTGLAKGGIASILIDTTGTVDAPFLTASASTLTNQTSRTGSANGGIASIGILDGTVTSDEINIRADTVIDTENGQNVGSVNGLSAGDGTGGNASLSVDGGSLTANNLTITANGQAMGQNPDGNANIDEGSAIEDQLAGGNGRGGNAEFSISGGSADFADFVSIEASGKGGNGFINSDAFATQPATAGRGGEGIGGQASLSISGGVLTTPTVDLRSEGTGGDGGAFWGPDAGNAGAGGTGQGGTADFGATQDVFFVNTLTLTATGKGGVGGISAVPIIDGSLLGYGNGAAAGGSGGMGAGGRATVELDFDPALLSVIIDASGIGGAGGLGFTGGRGGNGFGGRDEGDGANLELNFGDLSVDDLILRSNGTGGNGGRGTGGLGGGGGDGTGGDASLLARGAGSNLTTVGVLVQANAAGGNAGASSGMTNGAAGGNAAGGSARINIINSATADLGATRLESLARGGIGGSTLLAGEGGGAGSFVGGNGGAAIGGNASLSVNLATANSTDIALVADAQGGNGVAGGIGGQATGGNIAVAAVTGSFDANNATLTSDARGGNGAASTGGNATISATGGTIGFNATTVSANGETGLGTGGLVSILTDADASGTSGSLALGDTVLSSDGNNGAGGTVVIDNDNGNPVGGTIQFGQLFASADGNAATNPARGIFIRANQSDILVGGNANLFARNSIGIDAIGQGTFAVSGGLNGTANDIVITHTGQPGAIDTVRGNIVSFFATRNFDAQNGSIIRATDFADVEAGNGFANVDGLFAVNTSNITAGTDVSIRNATIANGSLNVSAGRVFSDPPSRRRATATIQGAVTVSDRLLVNSGGDIVVTGGAIIRAGNDVVLNSGDDIIIRNSTISSAQNVTTSGAIQLNAGALTPIDPLPGEIRSIVIANSTLTSTGFDLNLAADAIDATTATINANRFTALINNPPAPGAVGGNDGGLLTGNCVQGNICLGAISTPTQILVGPATGTVGLANRVTIAGSLASNNITVRARDSLAFTGPINVTATDALLLSVLNGPIDLTGVITLRGDNSLNLFAGAGAINAPNTALVSNGNIGLFANGGISAGSVDAGGVLNTINSDGSVATAGSLVTPGNVTVAGQLAVRGGAANINSGGTITTGSILTMTGNDVLLTSTGAQTLGTVNAGRDLLVSAASLNVTTVMAQRDMRATVVGGITLGNTAAGNDIFLTAGGAQTLGTVNAGRDLMVSAASLNATTVMAQRDMRATVVGGIALGNTTAGNDILLTSTGAQSLGTVNSGRDVIVNAASLNASSISAQRNVNAVVSGSATFGSTNGALINVTAGEDATFNSNTTATTAIDVRANGRAAFGGTANAPNITIRSGNIAIASEGQIGVIGTTQNVTLINSAGAQMTIGGSGVSAGYSLSNSEVARIFANDINIGWSANLATTGVAVSPPAGGFGQPSIVIDALTLTSRATNQSGNLAANGAFSINTSGAMRVTGAVALNGAGAGNSIRLTAGQSLQIVAGQGSIAIRDGTTGLAGSIELTAADIIAASSSAIADIGGLTDPAAINTRLGLNDGFVSDGGLLSAGTVNLNGGNSVFVQNTGAGTAFADRRGITANAINIRLTNPDGLVVINGQITAAPGFATGLAAIPLLSINGTPSQTAAGFNTFSTMNGCQITATASCSVQREDPASISVTNDDINRPLDPDQTGDNQFPTALIELKETETFGYPPLIDEPVTGSGNDDLWPATCQPDDENCPVPPVPGQ